MLFHIVNLFIILVFLKTFFEYDEVNIHLNNHKNDDFDEKIRRIGDIKFPLYDKEVDKLVFIVIDALRYDFITQEKMPYTFKAAEDRGCVFKVKTHMPTVTLPRIKSLMCGNVPKFIDVLFNLGQTSKITDSFLHQAKKKSFKSVFYGDNTWLKLFPNDVFTRSEGVTSFYVTDFYEVDNNVTRNVRKELNKTEEWDMMFLHYLGLDHIGHVHGPFSPLIKPKLKEMDSIIQEISSSLTNNTKDKTFLIMITGDHGMKDSGGHGGSTQPEINVPLIILNTKCKGKGKGATTNIDQTDIPITLAYLMSTNIPSTNKGKLITQLTSFNSSNKLNKLLYTLRYNIIQLKKNLNSKNTNYITEETFFIKANELHYKYLSTVGQENQEIHGLKAKELYEKCLNELTTHSSTSSSSKEKEDEKNEQGILILVTFILIIITIYKTIFLLTKLYFKQANCLLEKLILLLTFLQPLTLFSSSFIEEEHQIWIYYTSTGFILLIYLVIINFSSSHSSSLKLLKISVLTIIYVCVLKQQFTTKLFPLFILHFVSFITIGLWIWLYCDLKDKFVVGLSAVVLLLTNFCYRLFLDDGNLYFVRLIWFELFFFVFINFFRKSFLCNFDLLWVLIQVLLVRSSNLLLLALFLHSSLFILRFISKKNNYFLLLGLVWLGQAFYFLQGNGNSISDVDISVGYTGLNDYNAILVGFLILIHMYCFPLLALIVSLKETFVKSGNKSHLLLVFDMFLGFRLLCVTVSLTSCLLHKQHLFIWSVFSPKLFFEVSHYFVFCLVYFCFRLYNFVNYYCSKFVINK